MLPLLSPKSKIPQNCQVQLTSLPGRPSRAQKWSLGLALGCLRGENPNSDFSRDKHGLSRGRNELSSGSQHPHFPGLFCSLCSALMQRLDGVSAVLASSSVAVGWRGKLSSPHTHTHTQPKEACTFGLKRQLIWSYKHLLLMAVEITAHRHLSRPSINSAASWGSSQAWSHSSHLSRPPGSWPDVACASVSDAAVLHLCLGSVV